MSQQRQGEIDLAEGYVFRWMMTGTIVPEIYGWIELDSTMIKETCGWYRTDDPSVAAIRASNVLA